MASVNCRARCAVRPRTTGSVQQFRGHCGSLNDQAGIVFRINRGDRTGLAENLRHPLAVQPQQHLRVGTLLLRLGQAQHRGRIGSGFRQPFAGLGVGDLHHAVGLFVGGLGKFFRFGARVGHGFVGLLAGRQHRVESVDRRVGRLDCTSTRATSMPMPCPPPTQPSA
jgi:hypothetical protein